MSGMRAEMHTRIDGLRSEMESRMDKLRSEIMSEIEKLRLEMQGEITGLRSEIGELKSEIHKNFRWLVGIIIGVLFPMWVTIILTILFKR